MGYTVHELNKLEGLLMSNDFDITRWRSFAERYLVERASVFEPGKEIEGIWTEVNNALSAYEHIYHVGMANNGKPIQAPEVPAMPLSFETKQRMDALILSPADKAWYHGLMSKFHKAKVAVW